MLIRTDYFTGWINPQNINYISIREVKVPEEFKKYKPENRWLVEINFSKETILIERFNTEEAAWDFVRELTQRGDFITELQITQKED